MFFVRPQNAVREVSRCIVLEPKLCHLDIQHNRHGIVSASDDMEGALIHCISISTRFPGSIAWGERCPVLQHNSGTNLVAVAG